MPPTRPSSSSAPPATRPRSTFSPLAILLTLLVPLFALSSYLPAPQSRDLQILTRSFSSLKDDIDAAPRALILTAHPDDEVMFFSPSIIGLLEHRWELSALCLSSGNSSGLGEIRKSELQESYEALGVPRQNVTIIEHPELEDSMTQVWDPTLVGSIVEDHLSLYPVDLIITFDLKGITNHPNHIALALSLRHLHAPRVLHLVSPSTIPKFTGPFYPLYLRVQHILSRLIESAPAAADVNSGVDQPQSQSESDSKSTRYVVISSPAQWLAATTAMMHHRSQLVWFRWLYLAASRLMWVNELVVG